MISILEEMLMDDDLLDLESDEDSGLEVANERCACTRRPLHLPGRRRRGRFLWNVQHHTPSDRSWRAGNQPKASPLTKPGPSVARKILLRTRSATRRRQPERDHRAMKRLTRDVAQLLRNPDASLISVLAYVECHTKHMA